MAAGDINYDELARAIARALGSELDRRNLGDTSSSGYRGRNRFEDDDDDEGRSFDEREWGRSETRLQRGTNSVIGAASRFAGALEGMVNHIRNIDREFMHLADNWAKVDDAAAKYARSMGQTVAGMKEARERALRDAVHGHIGLEFGMNASELMEAQTNYTKAVGRSLRMSKEDHRSLAAITSVFGSETTDLLANFEKFGLSIDTAGQHLGKMYKEAGKAGISLEQYAKNVQQGLATAQKYNFSNGLKGMEAMAKRAAAIRMDMAQVESFANNFDTIEKTIQNSAKLQVLGGNFAQGADALGLLHASLSDMEELEQRMESFTKGIAVFDRTTGEAKIGDVDRLRLKQYADVTGQDFQKVMEVARRQTLKEEIGAQIAASSHASGLSDEMKEMIKNIGTFENGKAGVSINGEFKSIEDLVDKDLKALQEEQFNDSDNIKDIAKNVRSLVELRKGVRAQYESVQAFTVGSAVGGAMKGLTKFFTTLGGFANSILGVVAVVSGLMGGLSMIRGGRSIYRGGRFAGSVLRGGAGRVGGSANAIGNFFGRGGGSIASNFTKEGTAIYNAAGKRIYGAAAESRIKSVGLKAATKQAGKKAATKAVEKAAVKKAAEKTVTKAVGEKVATKAGSKLLTGVAKGGIAGIVGAAGNIATDYLVESGKMRKGGAGHMAMKAGSTALEGAALGAMIGSVIPGLGNVVGGAIGAVAGAAIGAIKVQKERKQMVVDNQLQALGIERKGKYSSGKLKDIDEALQTGKMSNALRKKLLREGDTDIVNQINKVKEQKEKEKEEKREKRRERIKGVASFLGLGKDKEEVAKKINNATFEIQNAHFGGRGLLRGIGLGRGERIAEKIKTKATIGAKILTAPIQLIKGKKEKGESKELTAFKSISRKGRETTGSRGTPNGPIDVNINGVIKLETPNGQSFDLMAEIKKNPSLLSKLTEEIIKKMNIRKNGAYVEDRQNGDNFV